MNDAEIHAIAVSIEDGEWFDDTKDMLKFAHRIIDAALEQQAVSKDRIREIFMEAGFTIKEGQTDLKPYVYEAAYALLNEAAQPAQQAVVQSVVGVTPYEPTEQMRWAAKAIDPGLTHGQIRAIWASMWSAAPQPAHQEVDWTQVGKLIEVIHDQRVRRHIAGTMNWAVAVCQLMVAD